MKTAIGPDFSSRAAAAADLAQSLGQIEIIGPLGQPQFSAGYSTAGPIGPIITLSSNRVKKSM